MTLPKYLNVIRTLRYNGAHGYFITHATAPVSSGA